MRGLEKPGEPSGVSRRVRDLPERAPVLRGILNPAADAARLAQRILPKRFPVLRGILNPAAYAARLAKLLVLLVLLCFPANAPAHDLEVRVHVLPFWRIQVEGWYDSGDVPQRARVEVYQAERMIADGRLNRQGVWAFTHQEVEPLRIVVNAGAGHRREVAVSGDELKRQAASTAALCLTPPPSLLAAPVLTPYRADAAEEDAVPISSHDTGPPLAGLLLGVVALLLVAGAAMAWRQRKRRSPDHQ